MPRLPRYFLPDTPQHVIQRGNNRDALFRGSSDFIFYKACLRSASSKHGVVIHAYVLMTNHVHLVATPARADSLPRVMQSVGRVYVKHFNTSNERTGTLLEGRYKAAIIQTDEYLLTCMRYVELNPVRAGMVPAPGDYDWSSYSANAGGAHDDIVEPHPVYRSLGTTKAERLKAYRALFDVPVAEAALARIRDATQYAWAMGGESFAQDVTQSCRRATRARPGRPIGALRAGQ
jgi:putative transposase